jgi:hypothetical protein
MTPSHAVMCRILPILLSLCSLGEAFADVVSVAHPDEAFPREKTVVWTPLFQAAGTA